MSSAPDEDAVTAPQPSSNASVAPLRSAALAPTAAVTAKATAKRITKEAVAALLLFFTDARWPLNTPLPRGKLGKDLAAIAQEHGLEKSQIARQLKNFKDKKYRLKDIVLEMTPEEIKEVLEEGIGMEYSEFVCSVLTTLCNTQRDLGNRDINNFAGIISQFPRCQECYR